MSKTCVICKQKIIEKKERWVRLTDFNKGKQTGEQFYHLECWRDRFVISNSIRKQKMYRQTQKSIGSILKRLNVNPTKEYDLVIK
ncbi:hypothetical protein LCGC14_0652050 [marine sediment metagenome]|uniref:PARP-type domain-containing protein n=1 Tax=marine sediment metagenome TaxID=412755 RepID=A0A0F9RFV0_9ZZZZ